MKQLMLILLAAAVAVSQDISGTISGVVTDETGAVVPNATVTAVKYGNKRAVHGDKLW